MLELRSVVAAYGNVRVLKGVSLRVAEGEILTLIGANGAGKSTFMRALAGLHRPVEGGISVAGHALQGLPAHRVVAHGVALKPGKPWTASILMMSAPSGRI